MFGTEGSGVKKVGNCVVRSFKKTSVCWFDHEHKKSMYAGCILLDRTFGIPLFSPKHRCKLKKTFTCMVNKDKVMSMTPTPAVLTPACSDILRRIQALQSQSTYTALVSLPHWGWTGVSVYISALNTFTITQNNIKVLHAPCKNSESHLHNKTRTYNKITTSEESKN